MQRRAEFDHKRGELQIAEADTGARIKALQQDLDRQRAELALYSSDNDARIVSSSEREKELRRIRSADPAKRNGSNGSRKQREDAAAAPLCRRRRAQLGRAPSPTSRRAREGTCASAFKLGSSTC